METGGAMILVKPHSVDSAKIRQDWIPDEEFACTVLNAAHLLLPYGELWMCRVFNQAIPMISDKKLLRDVKSFIGQEGNHAKAHKAVMGAFTSQGPDFSISHKLLTQLFSVRLGDKLFGRWKVQGKWKYRWLKWRIGLIATLEHITCVLGGWLVENKAFQESGADEEMIQVFKWHGAEEIEHRSVAHDLHQHLGGTHFFRAAIFIPFTLMVIYLWSRAAHRFYTSNGKPVPRFWLMDYLKASRKGFLPRPSYLMAGFIAYYRWGFHPEKHIRKETMDAFNAFQKA